MKTIWVTWERHRRTRTLSQRLDSELFEIVYDGNSLIRYAYSILMTFRVLIQNRPDVLIVQTPSYILAFFAVIFRYFFGYSLVLDAHNGAAYRLEHKSGVLVSMIKFAVSKANLIIVTSESVYPVIQQYQQSVINLPDCIPEIKPAPLPEMFRGMDKPLVTLIASHQHDEPIIDILRAFDNVMQQSAGHIVVTGKVPKGVDYSEFDKNNNVSFTGFLSYTEFDGLIAGSDLLVDISTEPTVLVCGGYEAIAVGVPALVSDSIVSRQVFKKGFLYAESTTASYSTEIGRFLERKDFYKEQIIAFKEEFDEEWKMLFYKVEERIKNLRATQNRSK